MTVYTRDVDDTREQVLLTDEHPYVQRWRYLWGAGLACLASLSLLLSLAVWLVQERLSWSATLQEGLGQPRLLYQQQLARSRQQLSLWHAKQERMALQMAAQHEARLPYAYLLRAQQLALATGAQIQQLQWQADSLRITLQSPRAWQAIGVGLQSFPHAQLSTVEPLQGAAHGDSGYRYMVLLSTLDGDNHGASSGVAGSTSQ